VIGLGFNPGSITWGPVIFPGGSHREAVAKSEDNPETPLAISLWWLICVDDESALAVISISLSRS
jgi:hypothetical protein